MIKAWKNAKLMDVKTSKKKEYAREMECKLDTEKEFKDKNK